MQMEVSVKKALRPGGSGKPASAATRSFASKFWLFMRLRWSRLR